MSRIDLSDLTTETRNPRSSELDATTSGGRVELEPEIQLTGRIQPGRVKGQVGGGGPELRLATSGGNVRVESH